MKRSFHAFMKGIIDYAGLFPPADLSLENAIVSYETHRRSYEAWMLSRFIIPVSRLRDLSPYGDSLFLREKPWKFSVLGRRTETMAEFSSHLSEAVDEMRTLYANYSEGVTTDFFEIALPREVVFADDRSLIIEACKKTEEQFQDDQRLPAVVFLEADFEESWQKNVHNILEGLEEYNSQSKEGPIRVGFKLRCGGVAKEMFPTVEQIGYVIKKAKECNIQLKATAGLHHPVRHYSEEVQTKMHGFFNVFGAAMLNAKHTLSPKKLEQILSDEDADHFEFINAEFRWQDSSLSVEEIEQFRSEIITSFGSCSFTEPLDDLQNLKLLKKSS